MMANKHMKYTTASSLRATTLLNMILYDSESENRPCIQYPEPKKRQVQSEVSEIQHIIPIAKPVTGDDRTDFINDIYSKEYSMISSIFDQMHETQTTQNSYYFNNLDITKLHNTYSSKKSIIENKVELTEMMDLTCKESFVQLSPCELFIPDINNTHTATDSQIQKVSFNYEDFNSDDSVLDQNYYPPISDSSSSSEEDNIPLVTPSTSRKSRKLLVKKSRPSQITIPKRQIEPVPITHDRCMINKMLMVNKRRNTLDTLQSLKDSNNDGRNASRKRKNTWDGFLEDLNITNDAIEPEEVLTEQPRKRQKFSTSLEERKQISKKIKRQQYNVRQGCSNCLKKCSTIFDEISRKEINSKYWELTWEERRNFIRNLVSVATPKRKITTDPKRNPKKTFTLKKTDGVAVSVCKVFFLTTLGFKQSNDKILYNSLCYESTRDKRGKHQKTPACDRSLLTEHVESFHPTEPHYRREHAPLRRYIPSDVTITFMHDDFCTKYPNQKVSYELYRSHVKKMNISFTRLGHEECESCETYALHKKYALHDVQKELIPGCQTCAKWARHYEKYTKARELYNLHKKQKKSSSEIFYSADLEKVIMLPRLDTFKTVIFCNRLIAYNQTFAPLGKITPESKPLTALWHDGIAGRKQEDIMSAFYCFLLRHRDMHTIHIWLDNCSAQNKNWLLYSLLIHMVNSDLIAANNIILYYFEPGHTFMSCDQVHHQVELAMKKKCKLYDFADFEETVGTINSGKVTVHSMTPQSFLNLPNYVSDRRINNSNPRAYIKNISQVCFQRKNYDLMYKNNFNDEYTVLRFMNDKYLKNPNILSVSFRTNPKGIQRERKIDIINKLSTIMPTHKLHFWRNLPILNDFETST